VAIRCAASSAVHRRLSPPRVVGIDDCALRKGRVYGTILGELAQQRPVALRPERTAEAVATWRREHPGGAVMARDRAADDARGATEGAPAALQGADRGHRLWHLRDALTRYLQRITAALRRGLGSEPTAAPPGPPETVETSPAARPLPRYGRPPGLQQAPEARHAARMPRDAQGQARCAQGQALRHMAAAGGLATKTVRV
jgi:transposase